MSVCLTVCDEALLLEGTLVNLRQLAEEVVVVVTSNSRDQTLDIARRHATKALPFAWNGRLSEARNFSMDQATRPWLLMLDGDEHISLSDQESLRKLLNQPEGVAYTVPIRNYSRTLNLLHDWRPNDGSYAWEEEFSQCPGYWNTGVLRLVRNRPDLRYEQSISSHCSLRPCLHGLGLPVPQTRALVIHHFEFLKGGEEFTRSKTTTRLEMELARVKEAPRDVRSLVNAARSLFVLERDSEAIAHLDEVHRLQPERYEARLLAGIIHQQSGNWQQALHHLSQIHSADALTVKGLVYSQSGQPEKARQELLEAIGLAPWHPLAHNTLGIVSESLGLLAEAEQSYRRALAIRPCAEAHFNLGTLLEEQGRRQEAAEQFRSGLLLEPDDQEMRERLESLG